jgi:hypothetical protein
MQRDVTRFTELGVPDDEHATDDVKVAPIQADDFVDTQTSDRKQPNECPDRDGLQQTAQLVGRRHQGEDVRLGIPERLGPSLAPVEQTGRRDLVAGIDSVEVAGEATNDAQAAGPPA